MSWIAKCPQFLVLWVLGVPQLLTLCLGWTSCGAVPVGLHRGPSVHWLLTRLLVSPDTVLGAQVLEITAASRSEMDWFHSGNFPLMSIFLKEEVKITYFGEGEADMSHNSGLLRKGSAREKRKGEETFLKVNNFIQMVFLKVRAVSREYFSCVLLSSFETVLHH